MVFEDIARGELGFEELDDALPTGRGFANAFFLGGFFAFFLEPSFAFELSGLESESGDA